jgi:hypothetical protein
MVPTLSERLPCSSHSADQKIDHSRRRVRESSPAEATRNGRSSFGRRAGAFHWLAEDLVAILIGLRALVVMRRHLRPLNRSSRKGIVIRTSVSNGFGAAKIASGRERLTVDEFTTDAASMRIAGDDCASDGEDGEEGQSLSQSELRHHDCLSVRC